MYRGPGAAALRQPRRCAAAPAAPRLRGRPLYDPDISPPRRHPARPCTWRIWALLAAAALLITLGVLLLTVIPVSIPQGADPAYRCPEPLSEVLHLMTGGYTLGQCGAAVGTGLAESLAAACAGLVALAAFVVAAARHTRRRTSPG